MRKAIAVMVLALASVGMAWAGPFEDASAALVRGDYATALRIWRPMAKNGDALAQYNLGWMYYNGQGVVQDYVRAHMWWSLAAVKGNANAVRNRDIVAKRMTPQQIAEAQKLTRECQARSFKGCD